MTTEPGLCFLDAGTALRRFRDLSLSPVELLEAVIERAEQVEPGVNAFAHTRYDQARAAAERAATTYRAAAGDPEVQLPALLGLPVATKEKHAIAGEPIEYGLMAQEGVLANADHPVTERVVAAGGIIHARTTTPEFSCATVTHSQLWGITRNPWNLAATPGGSSGGAGASLASGTSTLCTASDIAGSTRIPAGFTGTIGYKAPYGRVPGEPPLSADWYRGDGPMARTVADCALLAGVLSGRHPADHTSWGDPTRPDLDPEQGVRGLRIGLSLELGDYPVHPEVVTNTRSAASALAAAGAEIVEVDLPWTVEQLVRTVFTHLGHIVGPALTDATHRREELLSDYGREFLRFTRDLTDRHSLVDSLAMDARIQTDLASAMAGVDVLLCPTTAVTCLAADGDYVGGVSVEGRHLEHYWGVHLTSPFNVANRCPVLALPSGLSSAGVPTGVQVVGHPFAESMVFRVGAALEALHPFAHAWPEPVAT